MRNPPNLGDAQQFTLVFRIVGLNVRCVVSLVSPERNGQGVSQGDSRRFALVVPATADDPCRPRKLIAEFNTNHVASSAFFLTPIHEHNFLNQHPATVTRYPKLMGVFGEDTSPRKDAHTGAHGMGKVSLKFVLPEIGPAICLTHLNNQGRRQNNKKMQLLKLASKNSQLLKFQT